MNFNIRNDRQACQVEYNIKGSLYKNVYKGAESTQAIRLSGIGVGIVCGLLTIATRVALIGENAIKGLGNIFGAAFSNKCSLKIGLNQFFIQIPKHIVLLPISCGVAIFEIFANIIKLALDPQKFAYDQWVKYDPKERVEGQKRYQQAKQAEQNAFFNEAHSLYLENSTNINAIKQLAHCYEKGIGTVLNPQAAINLYLEAANLGDPLSIIRIGTSYSDNNMPKEAIDWFYKAASQGNTIAISKLANEYLKFSSQDSLVAGVNWLHQGAIKNNSYCMLKYAQYLEKGVGVAQNSAEAIKWLRASYQQNQPSSLAFLLYLLVKHPELQTSSNEVTKLLMNAPEDISEQLEEPKKVFDPHGYDLTIVLVRNQWAQVLLEKAKATLNIA